MPTLICLCQCHRAGGRPGPVHDCCVKCPFCEERIAVKKFDDHVGPCMKKMRPKPAPETD